MTRMTPALVAALAASCAAPAADERADGGHPPGDPDAGIGADAGDTAPPAAFWRLERPADSERTWMISPSGDRVWVLAVNTVMRDSRRAGAPRCHGIADYIRRHTPTTAAHVEWARLSDGASGGFTVPKPYGFNAVGAFSDTNDFDDSGGLSYMMRPESEGGAGAPYSAVLYFGPRDDAYALRDEDGTILRSGITRAKIGDPYHPGYRADLDARFAAQAAPHRDDPRLQMWYLGNEIGIFDKGAKGTPGVRDFRRWIWSTCPESASIDQPTCARYAAAAFLRERYDDVDALNQAWGSRHDSFSDIVEGDARPVPYVHDCNLTCREDLQRFVHDGLLREWVVQVTTRLRAADPNHLVATPRLALGSSRGFRFFDGTESDDPDVWADSGTRVGRNRADIRYTPYDVLRRESDAGFDLIAVNVYTGARTFERPWFTDGIHKLQEQSGLPVFVSEFSLRARIPGWSNRGGAGSFVPRGDGISDQLQRGQRYRSQVKQLAGFRHIVGASWHAWSDRYMPADDSLQINMGLVQCRDDARGHEPGQRWPFIDDEVRDTNRRIYEYIADRTGL